MALVHLVASTATLDRDALRRACASRDVEAARAELVTGAIEVLRTNAKSIERDGRELHYTVPSPQVYPLDSWKWDLVFGGMVAGRLASLVDDVELADDLRALAAGSMEAALANQISEGPNRGMTPHMNIGSEEAAELFGHPARSFLTQPSVIAMGVQSLADRELTQNLLPGLVAEADWWLRERLDERGLPFTIHPWETGEDASADQDATLAPFLDGSSGELELQTDHHGNKDEATKAARFSLAMAIKEKGGALAPSSETRKLYCHRSPGLAAHVSMHLRATSELCRASERELEADRLAAAAANMGAALEEMWSEECGSYLSYNDDGPIDTEVASAFFPLYGMELAPHRVARLVEALADPGRFGSPNPIPTLAVGDERHQADQYWRGSTWIPVNYLVARGLAAHGQDEALAELVWATVQLCTAGFDEYYDSSAAGPRAAGSPSCFTWSTLALLCLDLL